MKSWRLFFAALALIHPAGADAASYRDAAQQAREHAAGGSLRQEKLLLRLASSLEALRRGGDVDARDSQGFTALMLAARAGERDAVDLLLRSGATAKLTAPGKAALLMLAAQGGSYSIYHRIKGLAPVDPQRKDAYGRTLFHYACSGGNMMICHEILREGGRLYELDSLGRSGLIYAAQSGNSMLFYDLVNRGVNPRLQSRDGYDLLMAAAQGGSPELTEAALNIGCSPLAADSCGSTALMEAARYNAEGVLDILLGAGADPAARDREGATAAMLAAAAGNARAFYKLGGRANQPPDRYGRTSLVYAACGGDSGLVHDLLAQGEDPAVLNRMPLRAAISYGHARAALELASFLPDIQREELHAIPIRSFDDAIYFAQFIAERCNYPADRARAASLAAQLQKAKTAPAFLSSRDSGPYGNTPLQNTIAMQFSGLFAFLLEQGADVNARDRFGKTPLMTAVECGDLDAVKRLISAGADLNALDDEGYSALMLAALNGWAAAFNLLMEKGADPGRCFPGGPTVQDCALSAGADGEELLLRLAGKSELPSTQAEAYKALCEAMHHNDRPLFEKILSSWPDANAADANGRTLLMFAASDSCRAEFVKTLIEKGADVNAADAHNRMPLQYVKTPEKRAILLQAGAIP